MTLPSCPATSTAAPRNLVNLKDATKGYAARTVLAGVAEDVSAFLTVVGVLMVLNQLDFNISPLLASANAAITWNWLPSVVKT